MKKLHDTIIASDNFHASPINSIDRLHDLDRIGEKWADKLEGKWVVTSGNAKNAGRYGQIVGRSCEHYPGKQRDGKRGWKLSHWNGYLNHLYFSVIFPDGKRKTFGAHNLFPARKPPGVKERDITQHLWFLE